MILMRFEWRDKPSVTGCDNMIVYHVAPSTARDSIRSHGINYSRGRKMHPMSQDANYFFESYDDALEYAYIIEEIRFHEGGEIADEAGMDIWQVEVAEEFLELDPEADVGGDWLEGDSLLYRGLVPSDNVELISSTDLAPPITSSRTASTKTVWRGLQLGAVTANEPEELEQVRSLDDLRIEDKAGIHWTSDPNIALYYALGYDLEGWAPMPDPFEEEMEYPYGVVIEAEVEEDGIVEYGTKEWEDLAMMQSIFDPDHIEQEVTVRPGTTVNITRAILVYQEDEGFREKVIDAPSTKTANTIDSSALPDVGPYGGSFDAAGDNWYAAGGCAYAEKQRVVAGSGYWDRSDPEPRWIQPHDELLADALQSWSGAPSDMRIHMQDAMDGEPLPSSGSGKKMRAQAEALLWKLENNAQPIPALWRGSAHEPRGFTSWTEDKEVAEKFAEKSNGSVYYLEPGSHNGIRISDYITTGVGYFEQEWIVYVDRSYQGGRKMDRRRRRAMKRAELTPAQEDKIWDLNTQAAYVHYGSSELIDKLAYVQDRVEAMRDAVEEPEFDAVPEELNMAYERLADAWGHLENAQREVFEYVNPNYKTILDDPYWFW